MKDDLELYRMTREYGCGCKSHLSHMVFCDRHSEETYNQLTALHTRYEAVVQSASDARARIAELEDLNEFLRDSIGECHLMLSRKSTAFNVRKDWEDGTLPRRLGILMKDMETLKRTEAIEMYELHMAAAAAHQRLGDALGMLPKLGDELKENEAIDMPKKSAS